MKRPTTSPKKATLALLRRRRDASKAKVIGCIGEIRELLHSAVGKFDKCAGQFEADQSALDAFMVARLQQFEVKK